MCSGNREVGLSGKGRARKVLKLERNDGHGLVQTGWWEGEQGWVGKA
jgi:hypothetical protein